MIETISKDNLVIVGSDFNQKTFAGGKLYFLNTGKLGKDKQLTSGKGDYREYTIWQTITHTAETLKDRFYLIIDEALRGMNVRRGEEDARLTIVQKFILGSLGEIPPIDLILGMSAPPTRFNQLLQTTQRTRSPVDVPPEDVRASGLLKDTIIVYHPTEEFATDMTLLAEAARKWKDMSLAWREYAQAENQALVQPALVIQVEDGGENGISRTDLDAIIHTLETEIEGLQHGEIAHCFEPNAPFSAAGWIIPKIDASQIQESTRIKVVLFKMALTTGWDCPRAEVMMSFRTAQDDTLIAQLIGRMVITPLARRIAGRELLNTVSLYLPKYHKEHVRAVIERLKNDPDAVPLTEVEDGAKLRTFKRDSNQAAAFEALTGLPTYRVERVRKASNTRRLIRLARLLTIMHEIDPNAWDAAKQLVIDLLDTEKTRLMVEDSDFEAKLSSHGEITLEAVAVEQGTRRGSPSATRQAAGSSSSMPMRSRLASIRKTALLFCRAKTRRKRLA